MITLEGRGDEEVAMLNSVTFENDERRKEVRQDGGREEGKESRSSPSPDSRWNLAEVADEMETFRRSNN